MGRVIESNDDYYVLHVVGYGFADKYPSHNLYLLLDKNSIDVLISDDVVVEYSGDADLATIEQQNEKIPSEYIHLLQDEYDCFLLPDKIENAVRVKNDGVVKGIVKGGDLFSGLEFEDGTEPEDPAFEAALSENEYEGGDVYLIFCYSAVANNAVISLQDEVILYYDPDTLKVSKVEAVPKE